MATSIIPLSVLDLAPIAEGATASDSFRNTVALAQAAEQLGYQRYWLAEHHNMPGIASAATSVLIGHVAGQTQTIRVGAGGVMLPNHAPLQVAEQFGTLDALYPGRIDLGLGRAPGSDGAAAKALRRYYASADEFPQDVQELLGLLAPAQPGQAVQAVPGAGADVQPWILGSSTFGAQLAAALGLPYAFASHFAPAMLDQALAIYHRNFRPSARLQQPHVMLAANVVVADTEAEARRLFTSVQQSFARLRRGEPGKLPPPLESAEAFNDFASPIERAGVDQALSFSVLGTPGQVREGVEALIARYHPDELMLTANIYAPAERIRSFELAMHALSS